VVYLAFVWMFHFPMALLSQLFPDLRQQMTAQVFGWTQSTSWYRAALYALLCVIAFVIGSIAASGSRPRIPQVLLTSALRFRVGLATALGGLVWLYYLMFRGGGLDVFGASYLELYNSVFGASFSTAIFFVSVGCFLMLMNAPRNRFWLAVAIQLAGSVPVLLTGARQFALIGPLVLAVLAVRRGVRVNLAATAVAVATMLWLISYVGETRSRGVMEGMTGGKAVGPVGALVEMGGSLETAAMAIDWIDNGDAHLLGGSYWLPFERGIGLVLPVRTEIETDPRAMHMVMTSRVAGFGGSAIAESYYNFSVLGTVFFLALGALLTRLELARGTRSADILGIVLYAFLFQARNWFISVPQLVLLGMVPLAVCAAIEAYTRRRAAVRELGLEDAAGFGGAYLHGGPRV
jgi:hypothetical protein